MTEIIYYSEPTSKIIGIFAIECSIVFGLIFITLCCCTGDIFGSKKLKTNKLNFEKYSSQYNLSPDTIKSLYNKTKKINKSNWNCFNFTFVNNTSTNSITETITETDVSKSQSQSQSQSEHIDLETGTNPLDPSDNLEINESKTEIQTISPTDKIYIIYEFNNLDKITKTKNYIESNESDEFDELEQFVNIIIKSFENKYDKVAIILKISSPGGSAFKFEHAYLNLKRLKNKKIELVGVVDKMAASGGYMLAMACDKIISSEYATIGSIGVIAQIYNWSELNKKVGLEEKTFTTGSHKNPFPLGTPYTQDDTDRMTELVGETFEIFKNIVFKTNRNFTDEQKEQIMKAKTFQGYQAIKLGLVDKIQISYEYLDELEKLGHNIWICKKESEQKSILNSLLFENIKHLIGGIKVMIDDNNISDKIDKIKLI